MSDKETKIENHKKRLIFRADHRGTKEMDLIMGRFAKKHVMSFSQSELDQFEELLNENDPNLYNWITGQETPPANFPHEMLDRIKAEYA